MTKIIINANTHFLDLSLVYGSDDKLAEELRTKENGKLKISPLKSNHEKHLLPPGPEPLGRPCSLASSVSGVQPADDIKCFNAVMYGSFFYKNALVNNNWVQRCVLYRKTMLITAGY
uniref:Uncharacterized protein n=1 Tax=Daphnia galeata TaxID=27404 RepID=A0A8J2W9Y1_9CRUS|nr:unnamed protein product [Daphnia galeata]